MDLSKFDIYIDEASTFGKKKSKKYIELLKDIKDTKDVKTLKDILKKTEAFFKKKMINKDEYMDVYNKIADKDIK